MDGATPNERLLAAARDDSEERLLDAIEDKADINCQDGVGNTPLHIAVKNESYDVLDHILSHEECDVDPLNNMTGETPLHYAIKLENRELRRAMVESLLEAGADTTIKDKNGDTVLDILRPDDTEIRGLIRQARAQNTISHNDIAHDEDDDEPGSGSE